MMSIYRVKSIVPIAALQPKDMRADWNVGVLLWGFGRDEVELSSLDSESSLRYKQDYNGSGGGGGGVMSFYFL